MNTNAEQTFQDRWIDRCRRYLGDDDAVQLSLSRDEYELLSRAVDHVTSGAAWVMPAEEQRPAFSALQQRLEAASVLARQRYGLTG